MSYKIVTTSGDVIWTDKLDVGYLERVMSSDDVDLISVVPTGEPNERVYINTLHITYIVEEAS